MIYIKFISLLVECNDKGLQNILGIVKNVLNFIQLMGPILCIVSLIIIFTKLVTNPDEKKHHKSLVISSIALIVLFFIPIIVDATMGLLDDSFKVSACWKDAKITSLDDVEYIESEEDKDKKNPLLDADDYQSGDNKDKVNAKVNDLLKAAKKITDYVRDNGFSYGDAPINPAINHDAKLVSCDRCVAWFLYDIGYRDQPESHGLVVWDASGERDLSTYLKNKGFKKITDVNDLQAGDIMFVTPTNGRPGHTYLLGNEIGNGIWERYDCGSNARVHSTQPFKEGIGSFMYAYRLPNA